MKFTEYKEAKKHGSRGLPLQYYYVDKRHPQYVMPLHWHRETEILRVIEGRLTLWINNEKFELESGEVIFIEGGALHRGEPEGCRYDCAVFDPRFVSGQTDSRLSELIRPLCLGQARLSPRCERAETTAGELLDTARDEGDYFELKLAGLICELVRIFYSEGYVSFDNAEGKRASHRRAMITDLVERIENNYTEKITLAELAELAGVNEKYLCRFFKEFTGYTPTDYINRLRIERACYEMRFNHRNVTEAAYECGFNEISYFSKCFKKYKGISPGKYK